MNQIFNTREISILLWLLIFLLYVSREKSVRNSSLILIKAFFNEKVIDIILLMIIYIGLIILSLTLIGFWDMFLLKGSIIWLAFGGFALIMKTNRDNYKKGYLISILKDSIKGIIIIEFITNLYTFSLITELIIIPVITFIGMSPMVTKDKPEFQQLQKLFNIITSIFGLIILGYTFFKITESFGGFANLITLKKFFYPIILTFTFIPFLYFIEIWTLYENMFVRMKHKLKGKKEENYLKKRIFKTFLFNREKIKRFQNEIRFEQILNKEDIDRLIYSFKNDSTSC